MKNLKCMMIVALLLLAFTSVAGANVTIEFWHWHYPNLQQIIDEFNDEYAGDIFVEAQLIDFGEYYTKLQVAVIGGISPAVGIMHTPVVPNWAQRGLLLPIENDLAEIGIGPESFLPSYVWESTMYNGHQYGLPYGVHPMLLFYNPHLLSEAGLSGPPNDKDEFLQQAQLLTRRTAGGEGATTWGTRIWPWWFHAASAVVQNGASVLTDDGLRAGFDVTEGVEAIEYLSDLVFVHGVSPAPGDPVPEFFQGELALSIDGVWMLSHYKQLQQVNPLFEFGVASADNFYGDQARAVWGNGHSLVMLEGVSDEQRRAATLFMDYLSQHSARWIDDVPVRDVAAMSDEFREQPEFGVILEQQIAFLPPFPWAESVPGPLEQAMARVFNEGINPQAALEQAANTVNIEIRQFIENME